MAHGLNNVITVVTCIQQYRILIDLGTGSSQKHCEFPSINVSKVSVTRSVKTHLKDQKIDVRFFGVFGQYNMVTKLTKKTNIDFLILKVYFHRAGHICVCQWAVQYLIK